MLHVSTYFLKKPPLEQFLIITRVSSTKILKLLRTAALADQRKIKRNCYFLTYVLVLEWLVSWTLEVLPFLCWGLSYLGQSWLGINLEKRGLIRYFDQMLSLVDWLVYDKKSLDLTIFILLQFLRFLRPIFCELWVLKWIIW